MSKYINYKEQYSHPLWQKKRLEVLERANYTCEDCGDNETQLHVHHGYYEKNRDVWDYDSETLWCLCKYCHEVWEDNKMDAYYLLAQMNLSPIEEIKAWMIDKIVRK